MSLGLMSLLVCGSFHWDQPKCFTVQGRQRAALIVETKSLPVRLKQMIDSWNKSLKGQFHHNEEFFSPHLDFFCPSAVGICMPHKNGQELLSKPIHPVSVCQLSSCKPIVPLLFFSSNLRAPPSAVRMARQSLRKASSAKRPMPVADFVSYEHWLWRTDHPAPVRTLPSLPFALNSNASTLCILDSSCWISLLSVQEVYAH